ncbi:hypothetical protein D1BOALGB6SA_6172 [Olavius sp. associated proteobacterium Delta 1]|nr:hypothetical protein D1BOALGB6SA_6172 [Olavius sp. associated proteobacterium Delta 1]
MNIELLLSRVDFRKFRTFKRYVTHKPFDIEYIPQIRIRW